MTAYPSVTFQIRRLESSRSAPSPKLDGVALSFAIFQEQFRRSATPRLLFRSAAPV